MNANANILRQLDYSTTQLVVNYSAAILCYTTALFYSPTLLLNYYYNTRHYYIPQQCGAR